MSHVTYLARIDLILSYYRLNIFKKYSLNFKIMIKKFCSWKTSWQLLNIIFMLKINLSDLQVSRSKQSTYFPGKSWRQAGDGVAIACNGKDASGFGKSSSIYNCHESLQSIWRKEEHIIFIIQIALMKSWRYQDKLSAISF